MRRRSDLLWLPAAAVDSLGADVLHVKAVDHFGAVFTDGRVHQDPLTATPVQVLADEEASDSWDHSHGHSHQQVLCGEEDTNHGLQHITAKTAAVWHHQTWLRRAEIDVSETKPLYWRESVSAGFWSCLRTDIGEIGRFTDGGGSGGRETGSNAAKLRNNRFCNYCFEGSPGRRVHTHTVYFTGGIWSSGYSPVRTISVKQVSLCNTPERRVRSRDASLVAAYLGDGLLTLQYF